MAEVWWDLEWLSLGAPTGSGFPFEVAYADPSDLSKIVIDPLSVEALREAEPGDALVAETAAEVHELEVGSELPLDSGRYRITAIVPDEVALGFEALLVSDVALGADRSRYFYVALSVDKERVYELLRKALPPGHRFDVHRRGEVPFLRNAASVMPQMLFKERFGAFAARVTGGSLEVDGEWRRNIVETEVPILGTVTCHRDFADQLRTALKAVEEAGLADAIDPGQYAGCYNARFIASDPASGQISHHAWGAAFDINAAENPFGSPSRLDPKLVAVLKRHDLAWGGDWLTPDAMHFEWFAEP